MSHETTDLHSGNPSQTMRVLYLFPDTNVFIQCRPLEEFDWSKWAEFEEINLIICRPVHREIDELKQKGNDRIARRARKAHSLFREILTGGRDYKLIQEKKPVVKLLLEPSYLPSPKLEDRLDYRKTDDEIVGCVYTYKEKNSAFDVRLLTHDGGPMGSTKMLSLPFEPVPDGWLIPPEKSKTEQKIQQLEKEVERLKRREPRFEISCLDGKGNEIKELAFERVIYKPLSESKISTIMDLLKERFPLVTDFGPREPKKREVEGRFGIKLLGGQEIFLPTSEEEITAYEKEYTAWVKECENIFQSFHDLFEEQSGPTTFCFSATNNGTRPGKDALITITAKGSFQVRPPQGKDDFGDDGEQDSEGKIPELPLPPKPPSGKWVTNTFGLPLSQLVALQTMGRNDLTSALSGLQASDSPFLVSQQTLLDPKNYRDDPNDFYYSSRDSSAPRESFSLKCSQWRHGVDEEYFVGELCVVNRAQEIRGILNFQIHAENLSDPAQMAVPVKGTVKLVDIDNYADALVQDLFQRVDGQENS